MITSRWEVGFRVKGMEMHPLGVGRRERKRWRWFREGAGKRKEPLEGGGGRYVSCG